MSIPSWIHVSYFFICISQCCNLMNCLLKIWLDTHPFLRYLCGMFLFLSFDFHTEAQSRRGLLHKRFVCTATVYMRKQWHVEPKIRFRRRYYHYRKCRFQFTYFTVFEGIGAMKSNTFLRVSAFVIDDLGHHAFFFWLPCSRTCIAK